MSKYYWIVPKDQRHNNWLFYVDLPGTGRTLRERYTDLPCSCCRKFDEVQALKRGLEPDVSIRARGDIFRTDDGLMCFNKDLKKVFDADASSNLQWTSLPGQTSFEILLPKTYLPTNASMAGVEFHRPCNECGRHRETCGLPMLSSLTIPTGNRSLRCPEVPIENTIGRVFWLLIPEDIKRTFQEARVSGVEYLKTS